MSMEQIVAIVQEALGVQITKQSLKDNKTAKSCAMIIMVEEDYTHDEIAAYFDRTRSAVTLRLIEADMLLRHDKAFKEAYFKCIGKLTQEEDKDAA